MSDFYMPKIDPEIVEQSRRMTEAKRKAERREVVKKALLSLAQSVTTAVITALVLWLLGLNDERPGYQHPKGAAYDRRYKLQPVVPKPFFRPAHPLCVGFYCNVLLL